MGGLRGKRKEAEINEGGQKVQIFSYKTNPGDTVILGIQWGLQLTILHSIFDIHYSPRE